MRADARLNRERILSAAEATFRDRGAALSTEDVAQRANVGIATVFRHFPTKRVLLEATYHQHVETLETRASELETTASPGDALLAFLQALVCSHGLRAGLRNELARTGELPPEVSAATDRLRDRLAAMLERARSTGQVRSDVEVDVLEHLVRSLSATSAEASAQPALALVLDALRAPVVP